MLRYTACRVARLVTIALAAVAPLQSACGVVRPAQAPLTLDGLVRHHDQVLIGRFVSKKEVGGVLEAQFVCDQPIKGTTKAGDELMLDARFVAWRRLSDHQSRIVIFLVNSKPHPQQKYANMLGAAIAGNGQTLGREKQIAARLEQAVRSERAEPTGAIRGIGVHLASPRQGRRLAGLMLSFKVTNFSHQVWTVNVDRGAPADPEPMHRALTVTVHQLPRETERTPREAPDEAARDAEQSGTSPHAQAAPDNETPKTDTDSEPPKKPAPVLVYQSKRPWVHKSVIQTARTGRPLRPVPGSTVTLASGGAATGTIELRRVTGNTYHVFINGIADGKQQLELEAGQRYRISLTMSDDYHYWQRNGAFIRSRNPYWGEATSNQVVFAVPAADTD